MHVAGPVHHTGTSRAGSLGPSLGFKSAGPIPQVMWSIKPISCGSTRVQHSIYVVWQQHPCSHGGEIRP